MKQLNDADIAKMVGEEFIPDDIATKKSVRSALHLSTRIPKKEDSVADYATIDFHNHTEQEAWDMLVHIASSDIRHATVITGASGILKTKFQQWATESIISPRIMSFEPLNNGSFTVKFYKRKEN